MRHDLSDEWFTPPANAGSRKRGRVPGDAAPKILLYSHDSFGLGHLRRSLNLASALVEALPEANVLLVTGSPCASFFTCPPRVGLVKLPSVTKDPSGAYVPRTFSTSLTFTLRLRKNLLLEAFRTFEPQLVVIDHQVTGLHGEALPILREARRTGARTVLGVRDIIDTPEAVAREWSGEDCRWALREAYDRVCVYGDPAVFDSRREYPFPPELAERVEFTGYVARRNQSERCRPVPARRPQVLVTTGGGEDGAQRIDTYLESLELGPTSWDSTIVAGPLLGGREARRLRRRARLANTLHGPRTNGRVDLHRHHADLPRVLSESDVVVGMAGYNTCAEVLQAAKPAVLLPRTTPRREQALRAERLARRGLAESFEVPEPRALRSAIERALARAYPRENLPDLGGLGRLCEIAGELLSLPLAGQPSAAAHVTRAARLARGAS